MTKKDLVHENDDLRKALRKAHDFICDALDDEELEDQDEEDGDGEDEEE